MSGMNFAKAASARSISVGRCAGSSIAKRPLAPNYVWSRRIVSVGRAEAEDASVVRSISGQGFRLVTTERRRFGSGHRDDLSGIVIAMHHSLRLRIVGNHRLNIILQGLSGKSGSAIVMPLEIVACPYVRVRRRQVTVDHCNGKLRRTVVYIDIGACMIARHRNLDTRQRW